MIYHSLLFWLSSWKHVYVHDLQLADCNYQWIVDEDEDEAVALFNGIPATCGSLMSGAVRV